MAGALIGALRVSLSAETSAFEAGMKRSQRQAQTTASAIKRSLGTLKAGVTGFAAGLTVGFLAEQIKKSLEYAGSLAEVSRTLGVTTKDLQVFRFAATQSGVAQDELEVGLRRLTVSMGKAELGSAAQAKAFGAIGISLDQLKGKNTGDVFRLMADGLSKVSDRSQRAAIEMTLMGRSGSTLDNLLAPGAKRLNELSDAAERLGIVLSDQQIQGAEETAHKLEAVKTVLAAQIAGVVASNANSILSLSSALAALTGQVIRFLSSNPQLALGIIGGLLGGRVGGLPGAVLGGAGGAILGGKMGEASADSNKDIAFRKQQLRAALGEWNARKQFASSGGLFRLRRGSGDRRSGATTEDAKKEVIRQTDLLNAALAQGRAGSLPKPKLGVDIPQFLGGGGGGGGGRKGGASHTAEDLERKQLAALQDAYDFQRETNSAQKDILEAKKDLSSNYVEQTDLSLQILDLDRAQYKADLDEKVAQNEITKGKEGISQAQAQQLLSAYDIADGYKHEKVLQDESEQRQRDIAMLEEHDFDRRRETLSKMADLATTQSERRKIELDILELAYQEKKQALQRIIDNSKDQAEIENARRDLANLSANQSLDRQGVINQTRGPLETYLQGIPHTAAQVNEALQNLEVEGIDGLANALSHVGEGWEAMRDIALQTIQEILAALIKMQIQKLFFSVLGGAIGGSPAGLGASLFPVVGGVDPLAPLPPGLATGGWQKIGGRSGVDQNILSINGKPRARVGADEIVAVIPHDKFQLSDNGKLPGMKGGGLLGALSFISPLAFLATRKHFNPLMLISPLAGLLGSKALHNPLSALSPALALSGLLDGKSKGHTFNIHVRAPSTGNPVRDRQTSLQQAADIRLAIGSALSKGLA